jgi:hypothetical protein
MNISHFLQCTSIYILVPEANMYFFFIADYKLDATRFSYLSHQTHQITSK